MNDARKPASGPTHRRWGRYLGIGLIIVAVLLGAGLWAMTYFGQRAIWAQRRYHAVVCACELVATHVERSGGKGWPRSWEELETLPPRDFKAFAWPRNEAELKGLVEIDFSAEVRAVASETPTTFRAIRPSGGTAMFELAPIYEAFIARMKRVNEGMR